MSAPLYPLGYFDFSFSLAVAFTIGIAFGFFLERGGLGNAKKLAAQFYLTDLTVFKVMFTAIVTAMLGLFWLTRLGLLDASFVYINPTYVVPQLLAGLLFGVGFVTGGLCPGTSCVAIATGKLDGAAVLLGIMFGIFVFGELFDGFYDFFYSTSLGQITLSNMFGVSSGVLALVIVLIALAGFHLAGAVERKSPLLPKKPAVKSLFADFNANKKLAAVAIIPAILAAVAGEPAEKPAYTIDPSTEFLFSEGAVEPIAAEELAGWIIGKRTDFTLIDIQPEDDFAEYHIPYAQNLPTAVPSEEDTAGGHRIVLYSGDGAVREDIRTWLRQREGGNIYLLTGGLREWADKVLFPDLSIEGGIDEAQMEKAARISRYFGGEPKLGEKEASKHRRRYRREGC